MATALELSRQEWQPYIERARQLGIADRSLTPHQEQQREELLQIANQMAIALRRKFEVDRVIIFGSLAHAAWWAEDSDVDIAVSGLPDTDYWRAWKMAEEFFQNRPVDFIQLEDASDSLRYSIENDGIEL